LGFGGAAGYAWRMKHKEPVGLVDIIAEIEAVKPEDFDPPAPAPAPAHECQFCLKQRATRILKGPYWLDPTGLGLGERITCLDCSASVIAQCNNLKCGVEIEELPEGVPLDRASHLKTTAIVLTVPAA